MPVISKSWAVTVNEVEALHDLFKKLSSTIVDDGLLDKVSPSQVAFCLLSTQ